MMNFSLPVFLTRATSRFSFTSRPPGGLCVCRWSLLLGLAAGLPSPGAFAQAHQRRLRLRAGQTRSGANGGGTGGEPRRARPDAGTTNWINQGTMGNFTRRGAPKVTKAGGQPAVQFNGTSDAYRSEKPTPAGITGAHARSIEVWVFNPSLDSTEECMVAWGRRGTTLANMAFNYGSGGGFSAVTHYDQDMGWGDEPPLPVSGTTWFIPTTARRPKSMTTGFSADRGTSHWRRTPTTG